MTNPFGNVGSLSNAPIGIEGVTAYCEDMNRRYPDAPYVWMVGTRTNPDGGSVRFINPVRKTELRNSGPRMNPAETRKAIASHLKLVEDNRG